MNDNFSFYDTESGFTSIPLQFDNTPIVLPTDTLFTPITIDFLRGVIEDVTGGRKISSMTGKRMFFSKYIEEMEKRMKESGETPSDMEVYSQVREVLLRENETSLTERYDLIYILNKLLEHADDLNEFIHMFPLFFMNVRGYIVFSMDFLLGAVKNAPELFKFDAGVYKYLFGRLFEEIFSTEQFRRENSLKLQKIRMELEDFQVGVSPEYDIITDVKCWKLRALIDEASPLNSYVDLELQEDRLKATVHGTMQDGTVVDVTEEELTDVSTDLFIMKETEIQGLDFDNCIVLSNDWKCDFDLIFPLIIEFLAYDVDDWEIPMESFMDSLRVVLANKILLTLPKCRQLTEQQMGGVIRGDKLELLVRFVEIIFTVDMEKHSKDNFFDDLRLMAEALSQHELTP
jgi:hypothetical protein